MHQWRGTQSKWCACHSVLICRFPSCFIKEKCIGKLGFTLYKWKKCTAEKWMPENYSKPVGAGVYREDDLFNSDKLPLLAYWSSNVNKEQTDEKGNPIKGGFIYSAYKNLWFAYLDLSPWGSQEHTLPSLIAEEKYFSPLFLVYLQSAHGLKWSPKGFLGSIYQ